MAAIKNVLSKLGSLFCETCARDIGVEGNHSEYYEQQLSHCDNCGAPLFERTAYDMVKTYGSSFRVGDIVYYVPGGREFVTSEPGGDICGIAASDARYIDETVRIE